MRGRWQGHGRRPARPLSDAGRSTGAGTDGPLYQVFEWLTSRLDQCAAAGAPVPWALVEHRGRFLAVAELSTLAALMRLAAGEKGAAD